MDATAFTESRARAGILALAFLDLAGFGMLIPSVQLRAESLGARGWLIGAILASMFVVQTIASPLWGGLSDRVGRKPVVLACTALSAVSMLVYAHAASVWIVLAARVLAGLGAANVSTAQAALADASSPERRTALMGQAGAAVSTGLIVGPALGGFLDARAGAPLVGHVAAGCSVAGLLAFGVLFPSAPPVKRTEEKDEERGSAVPLLLRNRLLLGLFAVATVGWFALACLEGTFGRLAERNFGRGAEIFGAVFAYESLLALGVQGFVVGPAQRRLGERRLLVVAFLLQGAGLAAFPFVGSVPMLFVASTVYSLGNSLVNPSVNGWCSRITPERQQGAMFGLLQSARSLGFVVGPSLGGAMFDLRPFAPYVLAGGVSLVAAGIVLGLLDRDGTAHGRGLAATDTIRNT